jgi:hypothetical protein
MGEWSYTSTILILVIRWRWVVSFTLLALHSWGKSPRYPLGRRLGGARSRSGHCGKEKILLPLLEVEHQFFGSPAYIPSLFRLRYLDLVSG